MPEEFPLPLTSSLAPSGLTARARALIAVSVERVLSRQGDPEAEIRRFGEDGVRHVIDWLVAADKSDAHWISRKAPNGVPVKLAKCGSLERLHAEADKAMRAEAQRAIARLDPAQAGEGEELEMTLGEGWTIVRLLTPEALDRESARMGHCVGNGAYDEAVAEGQTKIFSLRSAGGKSRLTIEIGKNVQVQARENATPDADTHALVRPLFEKHGRGDDYWADRVRRIIKERVPEEEAFIRRSPIAASEYARKNINGRWPEAESVIATDPDAAYLYAKHVIKGRWTEAESVIATDPYLAYHYAQDVINGRWPQAESVIATNPHAAYLYAKHVIKGRWTEAESIIATDPDAAYWYAKNIIKGRWTETESVIATNPYLAYDYATHVIKGRWPEAENVLLTDARAACWYARDVIKGQWREAESVIATDPYTAYDYAKDVIQGYWPDAESVIAKNPYTAYDYARYVIKGRWPEAESVILTDARTAYWYARDVIKGRWPEAETVISQDYYWANEYQNRFGPEISESADCAPA